jgi:2-phospho-L-lactate guanylyltransferase
MATVVVPFRSGGKSRLPAELRVEVALAMLSDVLEAATAHADRVRLVTGDGAATLLADGLGVETVADPGGGQGRAVQAALAGIDGVCLVVNADVPRVRPSDLAALAIPPRAGAVAIVAASDDTTNALGLPFAEVFQPLYGPGSAAQFRAHALALGLVLHELELPNLREDVDTLDDLARVRLRAGSRTRAVATLLST